ncbi:MAG: uracil-DNA glycosylase family protein [Actinomycetota bacterium]|nr:uracil-DNA glycosylase family protein [Actinomycetota bacterium]
MDRTTVDVYERRAADWIAKRNRPAPPSLDRLAQRATGVVADVGSGPGWHSAALGSEVVAFDAAWAMAERIREFAPDAWPVQADVEWLPFRRSTFGGAWAHKCYQHLPAEHLPIALAELHRAMSVGAPLDLRVTSEHHVPDADDPFEGRYFAGWTDARLRDVAEGAGFDIESVVDDGDEWVDLVATRARTLPDTVGPGMRLLLVGLNPSLVAADAGYGFASPSNRFWPAALGSGVLTKAHDSFQALRVDGIGMTDVVKRATPRADAVTTAEYRAGADRVERLVVWLQPAAVCFVGLDGYRKARNRKATTGWQDEPFGTTPAYVMPNPSGLNAHTKPAGFEAHLRAALEGPNT